MSMCHRRRGPGNGQAWVNQRRAKEAHARECQCWRAHGGRAGLTCGALVAVSGAWGGGRGLHACLCCYTWSPTVLMDDGEKFRTERFNRGRSARLRSWTCLH